MAGHTETTSTSRMQQSKPRIISNVFGDCYLPEVGHRSVYLVFLSRCHLRKWCFAKVVLLGDCCLAMTARLWYSAGVIGAFTCSKLDGALVEQDPPQN